MIGNCSVEDVVVQVAGFLNVISVVVCVVIVRVVVVVVSSVYTFVLKFKTVTILVRYTRVNGFTYDILVFYHLAICYNRTS